MKAGVNWEREIRLAERRLRRLLARWVGSQMSIADIGPAIERQADRLRKLKGQK